MGLYSKFIQRILNAFQLHFDKMKAFSEKKNGKHQG